MIAFQVPAVPTHFFSQHYISTRIGAFVAGGGVVRVLVFMSQSMPPLPAKAGWWATWIYQVMKGVSGLDPNATVVPPSGAAK
jgi:hypothetical protein